MCNEKQLLYLDAVIAYRSVPKPNHRHACMYTNVLQVAWEKLVSLYYCEALWFDIYKVVFVFLWAHEAKHGFPSMI